MFAGEFHLHVGVDQGTAKVSFSVDSNMPRDNKRKWRGRLLWRIIWILILCVTPLVWFGINLNQKGLGIGFSSTSDFHGEIVALETTNMLLKNELERARAQVRELQRRQQVAKNNNCISSSSSGMNVTDSYDNDENNNNNNEEAQTENNSKHWMLHQQMKRRQHRQGQNQRSNYTRPLLPTKNKLPNQQQQQQQQRDNRLPRLAPM